MRIESLREDFYNLPFIAAGKISSSIFRRLTSPTNGYAPLPQVVTFYLTERCNLNCSMCFLKNIDSNPGFIPLSIAKRIVSELMWAHPRFSMSGGEPFLYPEIEQLIIWIKSHHLSLSIVTNGTLLSQFAELIVRSGVDRLKISIDGPPDVHNALRRVPGTFARIEKGIRAINHQKEKQKKKKPRLLLYSLLHPNSDPHFIVSFAEKYKFASVSFLHILSIREKDLKAFANIQDIPPHYWKGAVFNNEGFRITQELIKEIKSIDSTLDIGFTPNISPEELDKYYAKEQEYLLNFKGRCTSPWSGVYIKPPSIVEICPDVVIGDIENERFLSIWNSDKARALRQDIHKGKMLPICNGCCNYYM